MVDVDVSAAEGSENLPALTGGELVVEVLRRAGVEYVFGICGHANVSILDALEASDITFVYVRHEQNAAHMADAYFRFSHKPGVVLTTLGPGMGNAVTGIWEAASGCSGVVVICGSVQSYVAGRGAFQELALHTGSTQTDIYRPFTKGAWHVTDARLLPFVMHRAFNLALTGRPGPVLVDIAVDVLSTPGRYEVPNPDRRRSTAMRLRGDAGAVARAAELLRSAKRPLIHAGNGAALSESGSDVVTLAERLGAPVTTSIAAHGLISTMHALWGGIPGAVGVFSGNRLAHEADVVLALGTGFCEMETSSWNTDISFRFGRGATLVQVDIDPHEIGRAYPTDVGIVGDVTAVVQELIQRLGASAPGLSVNGARAELRDARASWEAVNDEAASRVGDVLSTEAVFKEMAAVLPRDVAVVCDVGSFRHSVLNYVPLSGPGSWYFPAGLVTMGAGPPAALGAKLAMPSRPVICFVGDGAFAANSNALATAVEAGIAVVFVVVTNFANDAIAAYQINHFDSRLYGTEFRTPDGRPWNPDFVKLAESYGLTGVRVSKLDAIAAALELALKSRETYVIEVVTGPVKPRSSGHWDVNAVLAAEGQFKRARQQAPREPSV